MSNFVFNGRSRQFNMHLARDYHPTRDQLLLDSHVRRQKREEEQRRLHAAQCIQRVFRVWQARQNMLIRLVEKVSLLEKELNSERHEFPQRLSMITTLCWCYVYLHQYRSIMSERVFIRLWGKERPPLTSAAMNPISSDDSRSEMHRWIRLWCSRVLVQAVQQLFDSPNGASYVLSHARHDVLVTITYVLLRTGAARLEGDCYTVEGVCEGDSSENVASDELAMLGHLLQMVIEQALSSSGDVGSADRVTSISLAERIFCVCLHVCQTEGLSSRVRELLLPMLTSLVGCCGEHLSVTFAPESGTSDLVGPSIAKALPMTTCTCPCSFAPSWSEVVWGCLVRKGEPYMRPTSNVLAMLLTLDVDPSKDSDEDTETNEVAMRAVVEVAYHRLLLQRVLAHTQSTFVSVQALPPSDATANVCHSETEVAHQDALSLAVLDRLMRLMPFFAWDYPSGAEMEKSSSAIKVIRRKWLLCVSHLLESVCHTSGFLDCVLSDLHHDRCGSDRTGDGEAPPNQVRYRSFISTLFCLDGGLRLLRRLSTAAEGGDDTQDNGDAGTSYPEDNSGDTDVWRRSELEILCSAFAWPLYFFSFASGARRVEAGVIFAKLARIPKLCRQLWCLYRTKCEGLADVLAGDVLEGLCQVAEQPNTVVRLPHWREAPEALLAQSPATRSKRHLFWDPHPSISLLFFILLGYYVDVTNFSGELKRNTVLSQREAWGLVLALKEIVHRSHMGGVVPSTNSEAVAHVAYVLLSKLHTVDEASPFVPFPSLWVSVQEEVARNGIRAVTVETWDALVEESATLREVEEPEGTANIQTGEAFRSARGAEPTGSSSARIPSGEAFFESSLSWPSTDRIIRLLLRAPFLLSFSSRAALFTRFLLSWEHPPMHPLTEPVFVTRGREFTEAFDTFRSDPNTPYMQFVRFRDIDGYVEQGAGPGVYREFVTSVCHEGFATTNGLFLQTGDNFIYPNPFSFEATGEALHLHMIQFLGAMMGRSLRDGIIQDLPFALHFRNSLLGRRSSLQCLKVFDAQLYHHLLTLTTLNEEEMHNMCLTFTYTVGGVGLTRELELIKGGAEVPVTPRNCLHYINLVSDCKLNRVGAAQMNAFRRGLEAIVSPSWLQMFDSNELLNFFGGDRSGRIDIQDWRLHTTYDNPEDAHHPSVEIFWNVVMSLTTEQQGKLLKFCTSMNRPPLLGFRFMSPPFKIHLLPPELEDRLPSAATCLSMLSLPAYQNFAIAQAKIVAAIEETATFELA